VQLLNDGVEHHRQLSDVSVDDDWEIDPRHVSLGVEIGQGAFGRVLTGFYRSQQIAIKVLKGTQGPVLCCACTAGPLLSS